MDESGLLAGIDFGTLKREFRGYIDHYLDHQVLLNKADPFAQPLFGDQNTVVFASGGNAGGGRSASGNDSPSVYGGGAGGSSSFGLTHRLPGLRACEADPTTENIAMWIGQWAQTIFAVPLVFSVGVTVEETPVNAGSWSGPMESLSDYRLTDILGRMVKSEERHPVFIPGAAGRVEVPPADRVQKWAQPPNFPEPLPPGA